MGFSNEPPKNSYLSSGEIGGNRVRLLRQVNVAQDPVHLGRDLRLGYSLGIKNGNT